jgi:3-polyprenyl-4-hydroxybenzoate decarboxylase
MVGLIISHYYPQTSKKIKTILIKAKMIDAEVIYSDDDMKRDYYLGHIIANMARVIKDLVILESTVRKYLDNSLPKDWQTIRYLADRSRKQIDKVEQEVVLDFAQILDLVHNKCLVDRNSTNNLHYSLYLCQEILRIDPEHGELLLRNLAKALRGEIAQLDEIQVLLEKERENWQVTSR